MRPITFQHSARAQNGLLIMAIAAGAILAVSWLVAPVRASSSTLVAAYMILTVSLGGSVFIAFEYITGAGWSIVFRRVSEALAWPLWLTGLIMVGAVALRGDAYAWNPAEGEEVGTFWFKQMWLAPSFLLSRAVIYVVLWGLLACAMIYSSRRQDETRDIGLTHRNRKLSALTLLVFAPTFTLASCDWFMSLEPLWFSTVWGAYHFAGLAMSTLAVIVLFSLYLRRTGPLRGLFRDDHLHDLGKLLFGFSCFWMYLWFSQYMLIWYANIPEETSYFIGRAQGAWGPLTIACIALNWAIPFLVLLPRPAKRSPVIMARIAMLVLVGRWLDLYLMVFPSTNVEGPVGGMNEATWTILARIPEIAAVVCAFSVLCLLFFRALAKASIVPVGDPLLGESLHLGQHHVPASVASSPARGGFEDRPAGDESVMG